MTMSSKGLPASSVYRLVADKLSGYGKTFTPEPGTPEVVEEIQSSLWKPLPGPQTDALNSDADELFYGGAAGGGKSDLLLGLAVKRHRRSIIFRRMYPSMRALIERSREIYNSEGDAFKTFNEQSHLWRLQGGRQIED